MNRLMHPRSNFSDFLVLYFQGNVSRCAKGLKLTRPTVYKYLREGKTPEAVAGYLEHLSSIPVCNRPGCPFEIKGATFCELPVANALNQE